MSDSTISHWKLNEYRHKMHYVWQTYSVVLSFLEYVWTHELAEKGKKYAFVAVPRIRVMVQLVVTEVQGVSKNVLVRLLGTGLIDGLGL
jgi:hypothetical protein